MTKINELGQQILKEKYYGPNETCPEDVFRRVAKVVAIPDVVDYLFEDKDKKVKKEIFLYEKFFREQVYATLVNRVIKRRRINCLDPDNFILIEKLDHIINYWKEREDYYFESINNLDFMPSTPILINAGYNGMLSSCFFMRVHDSLSDIFDKVKNVALVSKMGAGMGLDFSELRPIGFPIKKTRGTSSGVVSFLRVFNETGNQIKSGGIRRAALLGSLRIDHPEIVRFIKCKEQEGNLSNFNLSVFVTDEFMNNISDEPFVVKFERKKFNILKETDLSVEEYSKEHIKKSDFYSSKEIWDLICNRAHKLGEPGIVFIDTANKADVFHGFLGPMGVNACSEQVLHHYSSCNLASINLSNCFNERINDFDAEKFKRLVRLGVRFLDNTIDLNNYPLDEIEAKTIAIRPIGLGIMGLHDLLLKKKLLYGSNGSLQFIDYLMKIMKSTAEEESINLGIIRGIPEILQKVGIKRRNSTLLTCPPTGTISILCGCSSGIEPVFKWEYPRKDSYGEHIIRHFMQDKLGDANTTDYAKTALEIDPISHVKVQAKLQEYIDSSISKTVNLSEKATVDEVSNIFRTAYESKCKSITVYRSGSRKEEVLVSEKSEGTDYPEKPKEVQRIRPHILLGATIRINTPSGPCYVTISEDKEGIREVILNVSKSGTDVSAFAESQGRLISNSLQYRVPVKSIIGHLKDQKSNPIWEKGGCLIKSVPDAVARAMEIYIENFEGLSEFIDDEVLETIERKMPLVEGGQEQKLSGDLCSQCGEGLVVKEGGCEICKSCGFEKCG